jgi:hypothetical protein
VAGKIVARFETKNPAKAFAQKAEKSQADLRLRVARPKSDLKLGTPISYGDLAPAEQTDASSRRFGW